MDIILNALGAAVNPKKANLVEVSIEGVDRKELLDLFDAEEAVDHFGADELLKKIGEEECIKHFGIKVAED
jgi:hypothetical protein